MRQFIQDIAKALPLMSLETRGKASPIYRTGIEFRGAQVALVADSRSIGVILDDDPKTLIWISTLDIPTPTPAQLAKRIAQALEGP
jgi:hypothetical protein